MDEIVDLTDDEHVNVKIDSEQDFQLQNVKNVENMMIKSSEGGKSTSRRILPVSTACKLNYRQDIKAFQ